MSFHKHQLGLSKEQMKKLLKGKTVTIPYNKMTGSVPVFLTKRQMNKLQRHHAAKKGLRLLFTDKQIKYHAKHGSGFWDDVWGGIKGVVGDVYNQALKPMITPQNAMLAAKMLGGKRKCKRGRGNIAAPGGNIKAPGGAIVLSPRDRKILLQAADIIRKY
jgi:hypothetical protein